MKKCKQGYYYCYKDEKCKRIPRGYRVGLGGWLRKEKEEEKSEDTAETETKKNGNGDSNGGNGDGGAVSEGWSEKYKKSIDCKNPKGFSQRAHCQGRKKVSEEKMSPAQKRKDTMLKKKYDKSDMKQNMIDQYGEEEGTKIYFATIRKQAMKKKTKKMNEAKEKGDHEVSMARKQVEKSADNLKKLAKVLSKKTDKDNLPAWVQAKITNIEHGTDAASSYMDEGKRDGKSAKDKGYSLRDWFKGGGWVQAGGKYDGKPCAKQPGQKTKPFCRDADDRASMSKKERNRRAAKKRREDPNPNRKGKAKMVTEQVKTGPGTKYKDPDDALRKILGPGETVVPSKPLKSANINASFSNWRQELDLLENNPRVTGIPNNPSAFERIDAATPGPGAWTYYGFREKHREPYKYNDPYTGPNYDKNKTTHQQRREYMAGGGNAAMREKGQTPDQVRAQGRKNLEARPPNPNVHNWTNERGEKVYAGNPPMIFNVKNSYEPEGKLVDEGKKDACYHKVKSRYSVWPSAYASGALVKCRKVGAKNWGNKTKKESYEYSNWRDDFIPTDYETVDLITADPIQVPDSNIQKIEEAKKCWKGYEKKGTQKLFGKTYNRCVKKEELSNWRSELNLQEDWQKVNKKDKTDGMSQKAVNAYKRENPGSKLKTAVTGKVKKGSKDAKRRKSFCARSDGQRKMHNIDCSKTPDKAICKARKRWRC